MGRENRKRLETEAELLDAFWDLLSDGAPESEEEVQAFLIERGYNLEELNARAEHVLKPALDTSPLDWRNRAQRKMKEAKQRRARRTRSGHTTRQDNIEVITKIQGRSGAAAPAYFRNSDFDSLSDEELQDIRYELEFLQAEDGDKPAENE